MKIALAAALLMLVVTGAASSASGPPAAGVGAARTGAALYAANCSSCHGSHGQGIPPPGRPGVGNLHGEGPPLEDAGALAADFYLRTGFMPLADPRREPSNSPVLFSEANIRKLVAYVASLGHGPPIPKPDPAKGSLSEGFQLFSDHCAGCHQTLGRGGYATGARVPPLTGLTEVEVAEAVRAGPYLMPRFGPKAISDQQLDSIVRYVVYVQHPDSPGGWAIGLIGPVPEGMVAWLIAATALVGTCLVLGRRARHA